MGITLTSKTVSSTYDALLKLSDNDQLTGAFKLITDGLGNDSGISINNSGDVNISGILVVGERVNTPILQLTGGVGSQGTLSWNADEETVDLVQNGTTTPLNQATELHVKNQTGATIAKGTPVRAAGTLGVSGRILIAPMIANGTIEAKYFLGVTNEAIANGEDGKVITFGKIKSINTAAYTEGQTLWVSATTAGAFTTTRPLAPNLDLEVAIVINSHVNNGTIFVRATNGHYLGTAHDVNISSVAENDLLVYKTNRWVNTKTIGDLTAANVTLSGYLRGPATFVIDPAAYGDETGLVQILGDLRVDGTTTTINSTTISVSDKNITLAKDAATAGDANGAGITIAGANATLTYLSATDDFTFNKNVNASRFFGPLTGNVTGTVSTLSNHDTDDLDEGTTNLYFTTARARDSFSAGTGVAINAGEISIGQSVGTTDNVTFGIVTASLSGNATTASALATARNIALDGSVTGNADFDGSGNITITTTTNHNHDDRYYTETEVGNFFSGTTAITGYNKTNWDSAYSYSQIGHLPLTGGTLTGQLTLDDKLTITGTTNNFVIDEEADGTWHLYDTFQDNGIVLYSGSGGMDFQYNGVTEMTIDGSGVSFTGTINLDAADLNIGAADIIFDTTSGGAVRGLIWNVAGEGFLSKITSGGLEGGKVTIYTNIGTTTVGSTFEIYGANGLGLSLSNSGILTAGGGTSTQWNTAYSYSQEGHLPLAGGTLTGALSINADDGVKATYNVNGGDTWLRGWGIESNRSAVYLRPLNNNTQTLFIGYSEGSQNWNGVSVDASSFDFNGNAIIHAGNIGSQSVNYATSAGNASTLDGIDSSAFVQKYNAYSGGDYNMHVWNNVHATYSDGSNTSAWIVVQTSVPQDSYSMGGFELVFEEDYITASEGGTLKIYGYWNAEVNSGFQGFKYTTDNPLLNPNIYVARNTTSGNTAFLIQGGNTSYAQIIARNLWLGYSASGATVTWGDGWSISEQADQSGFTNIDQLTNASRSYFQPASTAITTSNIGNQSVAYAANAGLLDSIDSTSFLRSDVNDYASGKVFFTYHTASEPYAAVEINGGTTHTGLYINPSASSQAHVRFGTNGTLKWQIRAPFQDGADADLQIYSWVGADDMFRFKHTGVMHFKKSSSTIISTGGGLDAFGYNPSYGHYIQGTGSRYIYGDGIYYDGAVARTLIHSGNIAAQSVASAGNADTLDSLDSSQFVRSDVNSNKYGWLAVYSTIGANDNVRSGLAHYDDSAMAAGVGGQIVLGYKYATNGSFTEGAIIKMYKENGTDLEYGSGLKFQVRNTGFNLSTKMTLDPSGRLGVGVTDPSQKLHVASSGVARLLIDNTDNSSTGAGIQMRVLSGTTVTGNGTIRTDNADNMQFFNGSGLQFLITAAGKFGLANSNPQSQLHVGNGSSQQQWIVNQSVAGWYSGIKFARGAGNGSSVGNNSFGFTTTDSGLEFCQFYNLTNASRSTYVVINNSGKVGIGTDNPGAALDVVSDSGGNGVAIRTRPANDWGWLIYDSHDSSERLAEIGVNRVGTGLGDLYVTTGATTRMVVKSDGKVGIGTTNPSNTKVHIVGDSSYVGNYGYNTLTLEEPTGYTSLNFRQGNNNWLIRNDGADQSLDFVFSSDASGPGDGTYTPLIKIKKTGQFGIKNTSPSNLLTIGADSHYSPGDTNRVLNWYTFGSELWNNEISLSIGNNNASTTQPTKVGMALFNNSTTNNTYSPAITFGGLSTSGSYMNGSAAIAAQLPANSDPNFRGGNLIFYTAGLGGDKGLKENVRIQHNGFLGVGTSVPSEKMHVNGSVYIEGTGNSLYFDTDASGKSIRQYVANLYEFHILNARGNSSRFILGNGSISLGTSSTPFFYINTTNGHVGINSTSPSARLTVAGTIRSTEQVDVNPSVGAFRFYDGSTFYGGLGAGNWSGVGATADITMYLPSTYTNKFHISSDTTAFATFDSANSSFQVTSTIGTGDNVRYGITHYDDTPVAAGVGGQIVLGYKYTSAGDRTEGAIIKMYKENGTSGHYGSGLKFQVRNTGVNLSTKLTLDPSGNLTAVGDVYAYSDARVKENVETINNALDKVMSMRGVSYNKTNTDDKTKKIGVIAQEMQKVLPEVVSEQEDGMLSVSYGNIVGVLIEAIKEQQKQIDELKALLNVSPK